MVTLSETWASLCSSVPCRDPRFLLLALRQLHQPKRGPPRRTTSFDWRPPIPSSQPRCHTTPSQPREGLLRMTASCRSRSQSSRSARETSYNARDNVANQHDHNETGGVCLERRAGVCHPVAYMGSWTRNLLPGDAIIPPNDEERLPQDSELL